MDKHYDFCIRGAGLAGISLALELSKTNASICVTDPNGVAGGASGTPIGLANPATGRFASKSWEAELCLAALQNNLKFIQEKTPVRFYEASGILRPATDKKIARRMRENFESTYWPNNSIEWMQETEIKAFHPGIQCIGGGVWVKSGLTVDIPTYLNSSADWLKANGVNFSFEKNPAVTASITVTTSGVWSKNSEIWSSLPLIPVKGQTLLMQSPNPLSFNHAVSALGYIGSLSSNRFVVGSTYEHEFEHEQI
ncbi:MAG: FAD-binding oxidoreductase, partial [Balneolales bacterium]|nr:FAD-binding oxidoreductase [Balneolales bacterium]